MKHFSILVTCLLLVNFCVYAQPQNDILCDAKYRIVGKGSSGQESCSGVIYIVRGASSSTIKLQLTDKFAQTYQVWSAKRIDAKNRIYHDYYATFDKNTDRTDVLVQICSNNSKVRFVVFRHYSNSKSFNDEIYKTIVEIEKY